MSEESQPSPVASMLRDAVSAARDDMSAGRDRIAELHQRGLDALQVCGRLTSLLDGIVVRLFDASVADLGGPQADSLRADLTLVGLGSYGRRQLAPYSDVDLMLLRGERTVDELTPLVRRFTNAMFDAGFQLGHSLRTPTEAVQLARTDAVICSSLIDSRLLAGAQPQFESFRTQFRKMVDRRTKAVCRQFYQARAEERHQFGESLYLLEPHVKRSRGALRDLHLLRWVGFAEHGESDPDLLHLKGATSKFEHHRLLSAQAFLLKLRNEMHFHASNGKDLLDRPEQLRMAEVLGYRGSGGMLPVEQFMRDYFRHTNHLWQMVRRREASLDVGSAVGRVLNPLLSRNVEGDYRVGLRSISATRNGLAKLEGNLEEVLRLIELSILEDKALDHATFSALLLAAPECSDEMTPAIARRFLDLLVSPRTSGKAMRTLHELGYLEKVVPPMKHARCLLQFNQYHKYTVDEHSLLAIDRAGQFADRTDALGKAYHGVPEKSLLHLTLLLHDLGKGYEEDHSEVGRRIAEEMTARLHLSPRAAADVVYLVHKHLAMSHLAFRRDTGDRELVRSFAAEVATPDRLRMLFALSCADLAAVGPDVLTQWKAEVLAELYSRTLAELEEQPSLADVQLAEQRHKVTSVLTSAEKSDPWYQRQIEVLPSSFLAARPPKLVAEALRRFHKLPPRGATAWGEYNREARTVEFTAGIAQGRGRGALSSMAGALSSCGLQILSAATQILADDLLLLRYSALDPDSKDAPPAARLEEVSRQLAASVDATKPPIFRRVWGQDHAEASMKLTAMPNDVRIDNEASGDATVIEVFTFDRTGLLYALARKLHDLELTIWQAKISTYIDQVVDVFYVTNRGGGKIEDSERLEQVRREMFGVIDAKG